jgi:hypothetical protein
MIKALILALLLATGQGQHITKQTDIAIAKPCVADPASAACIDHRIQIRNIIRESSEQLFELETAALWMDVEHKALSAKLKSNKEEQAKHKETLRAILQNN